MMTPANPKLSRLETLPTELIEQIFFQSVNVNLPLASTRLSMALSSTRVKMSVVLKFFPSKSSSYLDHNTELSQIISAGYAGIGGLRSRILACRWMTWDFLKLCMETFVVMTLLREFRDQNLPWQEGLPIEEQPYNAIKVPWDGGTPVKESVVRKFVHEVFALKVHLGTRYDDELDNCEFTEDGLGTRKDDFWKGWERDIRKAIGEEPEFEESKSEGSESDDTDDDEDVDRGYQSLGVETRPEWIKENVTRDLTITPLLKLYSWGPDDGTPRINIGIGPRNGLVVLRTRFEAKEDSDIEELISSNWRCLWFPSHTNSHIPVKLLHGPWTQDQLCFLQALVEAGADLDLENETHRAIAKNGLTEAITENNYRAVDLLVSEAMGSQYRQHDEDSEIESSFDEAEFYMDVFDNSTDWVSNPVKRTTLGIRPDTEHLKFAVIERGCRRKIVKRLLWAGFSDIDRADLAVVEWAEKRREQGSAIGQWLLDQLTKSGELKAMIKEEMESEILRKRAMRAKPTNNLEAMLEAQLMRLVLRQME